MSAFEDEGRGCLVPRNDIGRHSLWPSGSDVPGGRRTVAGPDGRDECLRYVAAQAEPGTAR
ncbi:MULTISPECIES: MbtH family NRPS accessory protein [unclassified Streptomyces]|uniref:MbtH family NRPS accessory protein n=1 Tax=unclassified Streptomyces TaxID=2593676 RepID=UPI001CD3E156|nr:MbtH family NRPS accessory protein [Streptomyces sp. CoH27]